MSNTPNPDRKEIVALIGVGLDSTDGHKRLTRNEDFLVIGGSPETHENLQEVTIRFNESLKQRGKRLRDAEVALVIDLLHKATDP